MNQDLQRELRMLGIMIPTEDEVEVEEDLKELYTYLRTGIMTPVMEMER